MCFVVMPPAAALAEPTILSEINPSSAVTTIEVIEDNNNEYIAPNSDIDINVESSGADLDIGPENAEDEEWADDEEWEMGDAKITSPLTGSCDYDASTRTLTLNNCAAESLYANGSLNIVLVGDNSFAEVWVDSIVIKGRGQLAVGSEFHAQSFKLSSGKVRGTLKTDGNVTIKGGSFRGLMDVGRTFTISGGRIDGIEADDDHWWLDASIIAKKVIVEGGALKCEKNSNGINAATIKVSGGKVTASAYESGLKASKSITISGGKVAVSSCDTGLQAYNNINISGGTVSVTNCDSCALSAQKNVSVTGGQLTATIRGKAGSGNAVMVGHPESGYSFTYKPSCIKKMKGLLPYGTKLAIKGVTYRVNSYYGLDIIKYNSTKRSAVFDRVKLYSCNYPVNGVFPNAFNTKNGKKLRSIVFKRPLLHIGKKSFWGTSSLARLKVHITYLVMATKTYGTGVGIIDVDLSDDPYRVFAKTAFRNAGKRKGKGLTVELVGVDKKELPYWRSYLLKKGLNTKATVKAVKK